MDPFKKLEKSFLLSFSHTKLPEGIDSLIEDGEANKEAATLSHYLANSTPMLSFVFTTATHEPPSIRQIYAAMNKGYTETSADPELNESYGLLLDSLRAVATNHPTAKLTADGECESRPTVALYDALRTGAILQMKDTICALRLADITQFHV